MIAWVAMTLVGALGAYARYRIAVAVPPRGTLVVNLTGAFAAGVVVGAGVDGTALLILGTGFLGAYTTFSTWMVERTYLLTSVVAGFALAWLGWLLGGLL
jgi:fluoride exporter